MIFLQVFALQTYHFTAWWRNSIKNESISARHLKCIHVCISFTCIFLFCFPLQKCTSTVTKYKFGIEGLTNNSTVLFPRVVGHETPETGNHFILWVSTAVKLTDQIFFSNSFGMKFRFEREMGKIQGLKRKNWQRSRTR